MFFFGYLSAGYWSSLEFFSVTKRSLLGLNTNRMGYFIHAILAWIILTIGFLFNLPRYFTLLQKIIFYITGIGLYYYSLYNTATNQLPALFSNYVYQPKMT